MRKLLLIALHEYKRHLLTKRFVGALLGPLIFIAILGVIGLVTVQSFDRADSGVMGYVDSANALANATAPPDSKITFQKFTDQAAAKMALESQKIVGYYVLADDFATTRKAEMFYLKREPSRDVRSEFERYVKTALLSGVTTSTAQRLIGGTDITFETPDKSRAFGEDNVIGFVLPILFGVMFFIALFSGAQYLMQAVIDEKENRTMEILVTTVTPMQLMGGKVLGLGALGLTQVVVWLGFSLLALKILGGQLSFLQGAQLEPGFIVVALIMFVLEYVLFGAVMAAIGASVVDQKQAQQFIGPFVMLAISPEFFIPVIFLNPNGWVATLLSLFPFTAPLALVFRYGITTVPLWQIGLAIALLLAFAIGAVWLAGRIFRVGMLRYGQAVPLRELVAGVR